MRPSWKTLDRPRGAHRGDRVEAFVAALPADLAERFDALLIDLAERGVIGACEERA